MYKFRKIECCEKIDFHKFENLQFEKFGIN